MIDDLSGDPIPGATVIRPSGPPVSTDTAGRFLLENVEAGSMTLRFLTNRYVARELRYTVDAGETLRDQIVRLKSPAVIHGRVLNVDGNPAVGITVGLLRYVETKKIGPFLEGNDSPELFVNSGVKTNDLGEFRIFDIVPGLYQLSFAAEEGPAAEANRSGFPPFLYPAASRSSDADVLEITGGEEMRLRDITPPGIRLEGIQVHIVNPGYAKELDVSFRYRQFLTTPDGLRFVGQSTRMGLNDVVHASASEDVRRTYWPNEPGMYDLTITWKTPEGFSESISRNIGFDGTGLDLEVSLTTTAPTSGRLTVSAERINGDGSSVPVSGVNVAIRSLVSGIPPRSGARTGDDGMYRLEGIPAGTYFIYSLSSNAPDLFFTGVRQGETDALKDGFAVSADGSILKALLEDGPGLLRGTVTDSSGAPVHDAYVVMLPDAPSPAQSLSAAALTQRTDQNGRYDIRGIPPGRYRVYAWLHSGARSYLNPNLAGPLEEKGTTVEILKQGSSSAALTILDEKAP